MAAWQVDKDGKSNKFGHAVDPCYAPTRPKYGCKEMLSTQFIDAVDMSVEVPDKSKIPNPTTQDTICILPLNLDGGCCKSHGGPSSSNQSKKSPSGSKDKPISQPAKGKVAKKLDSKVNDHPRKQPDKKLTPDSKPTSKEQRLLNKKASLERKSKLRTQKKLIARSIRMQEAIRALMQE